jgi:hypothetical protein
LAALPTSLRKPPLEMRAPAFFTTSRTTRSSPRSISASVTGSLRLGRWVMAFRWSWLLVLTLSIRSLSVSWAEPVSTGPATATQSSKASERSTFGGESLQPARRRDNCARAFTSIVAIRADSTSSNRSMMPCEW